MSRIVLVVFLLINCLFVVNASEVFTIKGRILAENNKPIANVNISVGERRASSDKVGQFEIKVKANDAETLFC